MSPEPTPACPVCGSESGVLEIQLVVAGDPLSFALCSSCEWKSWAGLVGPLSLGSVLDLASAQGREPAWHRPGRPPAGGSAR